MYLEAIKEKLMTIEPGQEIATGMRARDTSAHTADARGVVHSRRRPNASYDVVRASSVDARGRSLRCGRAQVLADKLDRQRVVGFHLPFPATGFVERSGSYRFVPA
jgi:hypothetical protein